MVDGKLLVEKLLKYAIKFLHLNPRDEIYFRNLLLREFKLDEPCQDAGDLSFIDSLDVPDVIVSELEEYAVAIRTVNTDGLGVRIDIKFILCKWLPTERAC